MILDNAIYRRNLVILPEVMFALVFAGDEVSFETNMWKSAKSVLLTDIA